MLVLSRKHGERFQVGPNVRITIVKLDRNAVRIGIEAPSGVEIVREELLKDQAPRTLRLRPRRPRHVPCPSRQADAA